MMEILLALFLSPGPHTVKAITPCQLGDFAFNGQEVIVSSVALFTMHGAFLLGRECTGAGRHGAYLAFPGYEDAPPVNFQLEPGAMKRISRFFRLTGGTAIACGAFRGQLFVKKHFHLRHRGGITFGNGYGEHGSLGAVFVLRNVTEISACNGKRNPPRPGNSYHFRENRAGVQFGNQPVW